MQFLRGTNTKKNVLLKVFYLERVQLLSVFINDLLTDVCFP